MSTTQYATTFRINPATAQKAFAELVEEGVLYKRRGLGMFVAPGAREGLLDRRRANFFAEVVDPVATEARVLGIGVEDVVARLRERFDAAPAAAPASAPAPPPPTPAPGARPTRPTTDSAVEPDQEQQGEQS